MTALQLPVCTFFQRAVRALPALLLPVLVLAQGAEFSSLDEAPALQQRIAEERRQGNAEAAWELERALIALVANYPDDLRTARILRDIGDYRMDVLARYSAGEFPAEIVLGCYYFQNQDHTAVRQRGSTPMTSSSGSRAETNSCAVGSNRRAMLQLAEDAANWYIQSARIMMRNEQAPVDEVRDVTIKAVATSYRVSDYRTGRSMLDALLSYQTEHGASGLARAETLALLGDWDLLFAEHFGSRYVEFALATYREVLALLDETDVAASGVASIFSPQTPILLPAFASNRLLSGQALDRSEYLDVNFEIRDNGKTASIKVVDSSDGLSRSVVREVEDTIRHGRFRPFAANGQLLESEPVTVRYYIAD